MSLILSLDDAALLALKKKLEKIAISTFVASGAANTAYTNEQQAIKRIEQTLDETKNSFTSLTEGLEYSLKGKFGTQARDNLNKSSRSLDKLIN